MAVSTAYADQIISTYFRTKANDLGPPPFPFADSAALKAYWQKSTPGWYEAFRSVLDLSGLTITQANEAMKNAAMQYGTPSTPKILFDELAAKSNDTKYTRAWNDLVSGAARKAEVVAVRTEQAVTATLVAAENVAKYGPYLYAAAGLVGVLLLVRQFSPQGIARAVKSVRK